MLPPLCKLGIRLLARSLSDFGRKTGRNLSEDLFFYRLLFTWFWAKNGTKSECDYFEFWSMFLSNFLKFLAPPPPPPFSKSCVRYCSPEIFNFDNKTRMRSIPRRIFHLLFLESRLGFKFELGLNLGLFSRVRIWIIFKLKFTKKIG